MPFVLTVQTEQMHYRQNGMYHNKRFLKKAKKSGFNYNHPSPLIDIGSLPLFAVLGVLISFVHFMRHI